MGKIVSVNNTKGGVGKTVTTVTMAEILALAGNKVLTVDNDPQSNSTMMFKGYHDQDKSIRDIYLEKKVTVEMVRGVIRPTEYKGIDILGAKKEHEETIDDIKNDMSRVLQTILRKALRLVSDDYDYIIIDNCTGKNLLTVNSLVAADFVIMPLEADGYSYEGLSQLLDAIEMVTDDLNPDLKVLGVFITGVNRRTKVFRDLNEHYKEQLGDKFIDSNIRNDNKVRESTTEFMPLLHYAPRCNGATDYIDLMRNIGFINEKEYRKIMKEYGGK